MANIHICGFGGSATKLKVWIDEIMKEIGLQDKAITSTKDLTPESCDGKRTRKPYLRVEATEKSDIDRIIKAFKDNSLQYDTEWNVIGGFIPAEEMVPEKSEKHRCDMCGSIEHLQAVTGKCPGCGKHW